uniref:Zinc finger and BTB domain containing 4 n=1 Tax=Cyprinus carpio TaxID=7962 RepID=A0A8C2FI11_CYPCA
MPAFPVPPKEEPLEEGEVVGERADEAAEPEQLGQETRPGRPIKKVRDLNAHHAETLTCRDALEEEDHFVKVVDGHIIYFCSVCERSYMTLSSLKRHSNVHSWHRKYPCHYCDKVFALAEYRTKHEVWHTGERRYQCIFCWEAFPTYYNLKTHQKAFHGINPGLISSEKTANGGYKQKVNGLKLYRLLPMRSLKRPYKTYSQPMADGLLTSDSSVTLPLSIDSSSNSGKSKIPNCPEGAVSSVIAFAHSKPSVIMHSAALSSSVIVHRNKMDSEERKRSPENHLMTKTGQKQMKKHSQREHTEAYREWDAVSVEALKMRQPSEKHHKGRKVHNKTESSKTIPLAVGSEVKGSGPLCQITVRIGEEAIVKRSISETDLRRDKSPTRSKPKKSNLSQEDQREHQERKEVEKYFFRQEVREDRNDHDVEDNLWRPYYSYKPKRKALHMQGAKGSHGKPDLPLPTSVPQAPNNPQNTVSSIIKQQWSEDQASECGTCGRWFSSSRKRDKHELTHLFEFNGSPVRLGRRPLIRYTCSQCDKVCKTSAALNCHLKRHELCSSTKVEDTQEKQDMPRCTPSAVETTPSKGLDTNCEQVQPVSVIYYSKTDCKITDNQLGEKMEEHQRVRNCESPKVATNDKVHSPLCAQFSQVMHSPTLERLNVISPNLPSVLVMNGAECLDYRTPEKRNLDTLDQQKRSPTPGDRQIQVSQMLTEPQIRKETTPSGPISLKAGRGYVFREGDNLPNEDFSDLQDAQDLRLFPQSSSRAQDLSMPTILAKKKELVQQIKHPSNISKEQSCNEEVSLLVPKEEPLSPIPSPTFSVIQTTPKGSSKRYSKSPCHSPGP